MIKIENLRDVLYSLHFKKDTIGNTFCRTFETCEIVVDFDNKKIIYPKSKGMVINDATTSNFEHPENFVVLECVCQLLSKGYRPDSIELEPRWQLGRGASGGKADIWVKDEKGDSLLIIECKTAGAEFSKEKNKMELNGGQLFSYWQQEGSTKWLALYASDFVDNKLSHKCLVVNCQDDPNIIKISESDKDILLFRNAKNDIERYETWKETYSLQWFDDVIFSEESQAYKIGIPPLRKRDLLDFTPEDKIVSRFEEILRHNNVSDKENAFNRLIALFIAKLYDEIKKQDFEEVEFQYRQGRDTYEILQDRLQRLHKLGMEEFMREKITYVEADYAEKLFQHYTGQQRAAAIEDLNRTIKVLKFYSNNDLAFKDVHNEELFLQNGKILVEVVQLFQSYRIVYPSKHQFLGDLFEKLLNNGFKQNEGQFFTPTPITRFILDSLPIQQYISTNSLPKVIDFACGAGHFLTEAVEAINSVRKNEDNTWVEKNIYGIEKDYRLARVSKVSLYMNGAGGGNIIFGDGLENYYDKQIVNRNFDILIANPPYSVKDFKQHLKLKNNKDYKLLDYISPDGKEIETLFVERAAQLLKPGGVAAIILPSSILTAESSSYIAAREIILKNFLLRSIVCLSKYTFGATNTTTVILFLERYKEPPIVSEIAVDIINGIFDNNESSNWIDNDVLTSYVDYQGVDINVYKKLLSKDIDWEQINSEDYLLSYLEIFDKTTVRYPNGASQEEIDSIILKTFVDYVIEIEREKLYYYSLVWKQRTVVITSPVDDKETKAFLGYEWTKSGLVVKTKGGKLYDSENRFARGTLACAIRNSFIGADTIVQANVQNYLQTLLLRDMLDLRSHKLYKKIRSNVTTQRQIESRYPIVTLGKVATISNGNSAPKDVAFEGGTIPFVRVSDIASLHISKNIHDSVDKVNPSKCSSLRLFKKGTILLPKSGASTFKDHRAILASDCYVVSHLATVEVDTKQCDNNYIFALISMVKAKELIPDSGYPALNQSEIKSIQIPMPPMDIQKKVGLECDDIYKMYQATRMTDDTYRKKLLEVFVKNGIIVDN